MLKNILRRLARPARAAICYLLFLLTSALMVAFFNMGDLEQEPHYVLLPRVVELLFAPFVFFSLVRIFAEQDTIATKDYLRRCDFGSKRQDLRLLLSSRAWREETAVFYLLLLLLPHGGSFTVAAELLFGGGPAAMALVLLLFALLLLPLSLLAHLAALQKQRERERREVSFAEETDVRHAPRPRLRLARNATIVCGLYCVGAMLLSFELPILLTLLRILLVLTRLRWWVLPLLAALLLLLPFCYCFLRAVHIRRRFLKKLRRLCRERGFHLSRLRRPYRSLLRLREEISFTLQTGQKTYDCKLFCSLRRHCPLYFAEDGTVVCRHSLRFRRIELFSYSTSFRFDFESSATKICLVAPVPKELFAGNTVRNRPIDTGTVVGDYRIFNSTGFLNALARDCVDRNE